MSKIEYSWILKENSLFSFTIFFLLEKKLILETSTFVQNYIISVAAAKALGSLLHFDIADGQAAHKTIGFNPAHTKKVCKLKLQLPRPLNPKPGSGSYSVIITRIGTRSYFETGYRTGPRNS
jgi:hypothetical protein